MKTLYSILPPFAPDYSGVSSVFFELGGATLINGADGCTGNVTGYDEPRFFNSNKSLFSTGIREINAIMGDDAYIVDRLNNDKEDFVIISSTPVPAVIGIDQKSAAKKISQKYNVPVYHFDTTGTATYEKGASKAFLTIAKKMLNKTDVRMPNSVNIIGATPLDYWNEMQIYHIIKALEKRGISINSCWSMGTTLDEIKNSLQGGMNLVVSISGLEAAQYMQDEFHIPYMVGVPIGSRLSDKLASEILDVKPNVVSHAKSKVTNKNNILIIGEQVWANSYRNAIKLEYGIQNIKVVSFFQMEKSLMEEKDEFLDSENALQALLEKENYQQYIGDPLFKRFISSENKDKYIEIPHLAVSSRIYWDHEILYTGEKGLEIIEKHMKEVAIC